MCINIHVCVCACIIQHPQAGLTKSLAKELGPRGIRVNLVEPGFIDTGMTEDLSSAVRERVQASTSLGRLGHAEEVAGVVRFLLDSSLSGYVTGQTIRVDGGLSL